MKLPFEMWDAKQKCPLNSSEESLWAEVFIRESALVLVSYKDDSCKLLPRKRRCIRRIRNMYSHVCQDAGHTVLYSGKSVVLGGPLDLELVSQSLIGDPPGSCRRQVCSQTGDQTQLLSLAFVECLLLQSLALTSTTFMQLGSTI